MAFRTRIAISSLAITATDIGEAQTKPVFELDLGADAIEFNKAAAMVVVSDEMLRLATLTEPMIDRELRGRSRGSSRPRLSEPAD